jgi:hypothetical protein
MSATKRLWKNRFSAWKVIITGLFKHKLPSFKPLKFLKANFIALLGNTLITGAAITMVLCLYYGMYRNDTERERLEQPATIEALEAAATNKCERAFIKNANSEKVIIKVWQLEKMQNQCNELRERDAQLAKQRLK